MALKPGLQLRTAQSLKMTPQMRQAIELLQLPGHELSALVDTALETNPLLERADSEPAFEADLPTPALPDHDPADVSDVLSGLAPGGAAEDSLDGDENLLAGNLRESALPDTAPRMGSETPFGSNLEDWQSERPTLRAHLEPQIESLHLPPIGRAIAFELSGSLNPNGYLTEMPDEMAQRLGVNQADIEAVLARVQGLDPVGVFARNLPECLALQLAEKDRLDPAMQALLDHLEMVAARDIKGLCRATGQDEEDVIDMMRELRQLDPRPGLAFDDAPSETIVPDVLISRLPDGTLRVELNSDALPRLIVNETYLTDVRRGPGLDNEDRAWLSKARADASFLVKALDQRARSVLAVSRALVARQSAFFEHGIAALRPMTLADIAEDTGLHLATVSRVSANKYLQGPGGTQPFKLFFSARLAASSGDDDEDASAQAVKYRIKQLVENEPAGKPLSDDKLTKALEQDGIKIARRTVAKYREALNIPSSSDRRKLAKNAF